MSNPNNLIRPGVLNAPQVNAAVPPQNPQVNVDAIVQAVVSRIQNEMHLRTPSQEVLTDETIRPEFIDRLEELDKIPDIVKSLREFSGKPGEFSSWRKSVDRVLKIYESARGTPRYVGILSAIRDKIVGNANAALESYSTPLNWKAISKCLTMHYADKRDVTTLEYQLASLVQGSRSIQEYYQEVYKHLSLILNKIASIEMGQESMEILTKTYRDRALDTFIRGLNGGLRSLLAMKEPADLPQALHLCLKLGNQDFRANHAQNSQGAINKTYNTAQPPPVPKRQQNFQQPFYPQLAYLPRSVQPVANQGPQNSLQPYFPQQPFYYPAYMAPPRQYIPPKPQPKPTPMEVDQSIQTKNVNYMNRPRDSGLHGKRPGQEQAGQQITKYQRNFNIETPECSTENTYPYDNESNDNPQGNVALYDYNTAMMYAQENQPQWQYEDTPVDGTVQCELQEFTDIHFLD